MPKKGQRKSKKEHVTKISKKVVLDMIKHDQPPKQKRFLSTGLSMNTSVIALGTSHLVIELSNLAQGDNVTQREGSGVHVKGVGLRMSGANQSNKFRAIRTCIISPSSYTRGDLVPASLGEIFTDQGYNATAFDALSGTSLWPINNEKFKVYHDKIHNFYPMVGTVGGGLPSGSPFKLKKYIKISHNVIYDRIAGSGAAPIEGKLYLVVMLAENDNAPNANDAIINVLATTYFNDSTGTRSR